MFLKLCEGQKLNPFLREAHLVKYGNQAATMIVGKDAFTKRAEANDNYKGTKSGVIVVNLNNEIQEREGTFYLKGREELVGGWARVSFKNDKEDVYNTVSLDEYMGRKKDGSATSMWSTKPATMIRKVALVQALRDAFPSALGQMYVAEEMNIQEELPDNMVIGQGKEADISGLQELANKNGMNLKTLTQEQAINLIEILREYQVIQEVPEEDIKPVEDNIPTVDAEIIEQEDEEDPF